MAEKYSFFDSTVDDERNYPADDFAQYFRTLFKNGVFLDKDTNALKVTAAGSTMETVLNLGTAYLEGYRYETDASITFTHAQADQALTRYDRIVIRLDKDLRTIKAQVKQGVAGGDVPELERTAKVFELCMATVTITAGKSYIDDTQIADERLNEALCGIAAPTHMKAHANDHRQGGPDELTPEMIGAMPTTGGDFTGPITVNGKPVGVDEIDDNPADLTYYVRSTGDDNNDGLSEATAFKTLGKAMTMWKTITIGGKRTFDIGAGVDLTPDLTPDHREWQVENKFGGEFVFEFNNAHAFVPQFSNIQASLRIQNFERFNSNITTFGAGEPSHFNNCLYADINGVKCDLTGKSSSYAAFSFSRSSGRVGEATFTAYSPWCIQASSQSNVFVWMPKGTVADSTTIPYSASSGAVIDVSGNQITGATTNFETDTGGIVDGV